MKNPNLKETWKKILGWVYIAVSCILKKFQIHFFDYIEKNDNFEFRKALCNHDVDWIVLSSPSGSVWEGLSIAGIINYKGLNVYVPKSSGKGDGNCASACFFMLFAGATRQVGGRLGIHQFLSKESEKKEKSVILRKRRNSLFLKL